MLEQALVNPITQAIAKSLLCRFVEGDRILWSVDGEFDHSRWPIRKGTIVGFNKRRTGTIFFPVVKFDDETREDFLHQEVLPFCIKKDQSDEESNR